MPNLVFAKKWCFVDFLGSKKFVAYSVFVHGLLILTFFDGKPFKKIGARSSFVVETHFFSSILETKYLSQDDTADQPFAKVLPKEEKAPKTLTPPSLSQRPAQKSSARSVNKSGAQETSDSDETEAISPDMARPPVLLTSKLPPIAYPKEAKHLRVEGVVKLELTIDEEGQVKDAKVIEGLGFGLTTQALKLVQNLRFLPALNPRGEREIASIMHEVVFRLNRRDG